ncbi:MAG: recombination mediator RecR [bacterium]|nr:recombination mediator RecR [bacterium]
MYPKSLNNLIESFKMLPGVGEKTAERMAFYALTLDEDIVKFFSESLLNAKKKIHKCRICNNLTENEICNICENINRNKNLLCIVDDPKTLYLIEKCNIFNGYYYILNNLISPLNGINPEDIGIENLLKLIKNNNFEEIIIAVKPNIEGETTSLYIKKILEGLNIKISRLASGIPIGADIEYIDSLTLERAINDRKEIE